MNICPISSRFLYEATNHRWSRFLHEATGDARAWVVSEFENLLCGSLRISASSVFKLPLTERTLRYAEDAEKTLEFKTRLELETHEPHKCS
jgi:hypothetical protein